MSEDLQKENPSEDNLSESKNIHESTAYKTKYDQDSQPKKEGGAQEKSK